MHDACNNPVQSSLDARRQDAESIASDRVDITGQAHKERLSLAAQRLPQSSAGVGQRVDRFGCQGQRIQFGCGSSSVRPDPADSERRLVSRVVKPTHASRCANKSLRRN